MATYLTSLFAGRCRGPPSGCGAVWCKRASPVSLRVPGQRRLQRTERAGHLRFSRMDGCSSRSATAKSRCTPCLAATTPRPLSSSAPRLPQLWTRPARARASTPGFPTTHSLRALQLRCPAGAAPRPCGRPAAARRRRGRRDGRLRLSGRLVRLPLPDNSVTAQKILIQEISGVSSSRATRSATSTSAPTARSTSAPATGKLHTTSIRPERRERRQPDAQRNSVWRPAGGGGRKTFPPTAGGGALRSQSVRRPSGEPSPERLRPPDRSRDRGRAPDQPTFAAGCEMRGGSSELSASAIRSVFTASLRQSNEFWIGDVGEMTIWGGDQSAAEPDVADAHRLRLPCYEGNLPSPGAIAHGATPLQLSVQRRDGDPAPYFTSQPRTAASSPATPVQIPREARRSRDSRSIWVRATIGLLQQALFFASTTLGSASVITAAVDDGSVPIPTQIQSSSAASDPFRPRNGPNGDIFYPDISAGVSTRFLFDRAVRSRRDQPATASSSETGPTTPNKGNDGIRRRGGRRRSRTTSGGGPPSARSTGWKRVAPLGRPRTPRAGYKYPVSATGRQRFTTVGP